PAASAHPPLHDALPISIEAAEAIGHGHRLLAAEDRLAAGQQAELALQPPRKPALRLLVAQRDHRRVAEQREVARVDAQRGGGGPDRKSTRLNSSHVKIS